MTDEKGKINMGVCPLTAGKDLTAEAFGGAGQYTLVASGTGIVLT